MKQVDLYARVRHAVMIEKLSQREVGRRYCLDPRTVKKMLTYAVPPGYVRKKPAVRQELHPLWVASQEVAAENLTQYRSGLTPDQIARFECDIAVQWYTNLCVGNAIGLAIATGLTDAEILNGLPGLVSDCIKTAIQDDDRRLSKSVRRARSRLHFLAP